MKHDTVRSPCKKTHSNMTTSSEDNGTTSLAYNCPDSSWNERFTNVMTLDTKNRVALFAFNVILLFFTVFLNLLSLLTIRKSSQLKNKLCYFVILLQSAVDFVVGVFTIPMSIFYLATPLLGIQNCLAIALMYILMLVIPSLAPVTLSAMTVERYIGVLHPYFYHRNVTKRRILIYASVAGSLCVSNIGLIFYGPSMFGVSSTIIMVSFFLFIAYAYTRIFLVVRKLARAENRPADCNQHDNQSGRRRIFQEIKHAKSCFIVVIWYGVLLLPISLTPIFVDYAQVNRGVYIFWFLTL